MILVGLTGGIGMGKSTSAAFLREMQLPVVDTDELAKELVQPGQPALDEIKRAFDSDIVDAGGQLRRKSLANQVFADSAKRRQLESILHPRIRSAWLEATARWRAESCVLGIVVIPLLFETAAETYFDATICVACSAGAQKQRLRARGWNDQEAGQRINSQLPIASKMDRARFLVWSEGSLEIHRAQLIRLVDQLLHDMRR